VLISESCCLPVYQNKALKATWAACEGGRTRPDAVVDQNNTDSRFKGLLSLYVLVNRLEDPGTANLVIGEMRRFCGPSKPTPGPKVVDLAFSSIKKRDPVLNLLVDLYIYSARASWEALRTPQAGDFLHDFLILFLERFLNAKAGGQKEFRNDTGTLGGCPVPGTQYSQYVSGDVYD
jgi:hypothetical protein